MLETHEANFRTVVAGNLVWHEFNYSCTGDLGVNEIPAARLNPFMANVRVHIVSDIPRQVNSVRNKNGSIKCH